VSVAEAPAREAPAWSPARLDRGERIRVVVIAVLLALVLLVGGAWGSMRSGAATATADARRRKLEAKRDRLFAELTEIEQQHLQGGLEPRRYATRRRELVSALEGVYAEMDEEAAA